MLEDMILPTVSSALQRGVAGDVRLAFLVEVPLPGRLHDDAHEAGVGQVGLIIFLPVLASTCWPISMKRSQVMPCMSSGLKLGLLQIVLAVEAGYAGPNGSAIDLAIQRHQLDLVGSEAGIIDRAGEWREGAGEGLQILLRAVILDQHDIGQGIRRAGRKAGLQLLLDVGLGEIDDVEGDVRMRLV